MDMIATQESKTIRNREKNTEGTQKERISNSYPYKQYPCSSFSTFIGKAISPEQGCPQPRAKWVNMIETSKR
jgi:hypothetical protein